ncbi:methyltransferase [Paenibacillus segetis]|uniref:Methyltransferase n=2 Tax=Paenibacillus segetis TaxID=1325360 RepID=A0ABQ1YRT7_9BACL|nr:methyltransferase [Paenibacillus segetis]
MIWGKEPSPTVLHSRNIFKKYGVHKVLVPGGGYGRNSKALSSHFQVDVIELSPDAIAIAREWDPASQYIEGSALEMNLDKTYEGIYCYDLLHLFLCRDRHRLIQCCAQQLSTDGVMYFTCFSDEDPNNGIGKNLEPGTYEYKEGKYAHFFSEADLREHFHGYPILEMGTIEEVLIKQNHDPYSYLLRYIVVQNNNSKLLN